MFCKIFKHGRGKATGIDYLMSLRDANGKQRDPPAKLMCGNIHLTKRLINDLEYAQKYTSGVLSWAESAAEVNESILTEIIDSFQDMLGVGLENERLNWLWTKHLDKGRIELHWIIPNCDLETGKRFAPYFDRTDRPRFRAWERLTNAKYGFADPADPARKKELRLPANLPKNKEVAIEAIHSVISSLVAKNIILSRDEIIQHLKNKGYLISRQGKDYISIQDSKGQKLRLRGALYEANFININSLEPTVSQDKVNKERNYQGLQIELEAQLKKRRDYIKGRYQSIESDNTDHISAPPKKLILNSNFEQLNTLTVMQSEAANDTTRKISDGCTSTDGARTRQAIRRIDSAIIKSGRTAHLFCRSVQCAVDNIRRTIDKLRKTTANIYTY